MNGDIAPDDTAPDDIAPDEMPWLSMAAAIASISVVGIAIGLGVPLLSVILETRGHSASMIGLNTGVAGLASIAAAPIATPLALRLGVVRTILLMIASAALAFVGFYFAPSFWIWFPLRAMLHVALTVLFILSEFWISASAPPHRRGFVLGIYATVLSLGFAFGPWLFAKTGSIGFLPFGVIFALVLLAALPVLAAWKESPAIHEESGEAIGFLSYIWLVPTATAAVLVFGAVETGGFALFPVYGTRIGYGEADAALLLTMIGASAMSFSRFRSASSATRFATGVCCSRHVPRSACSAWLPCPSWRTTGPSPPPCSSSGVAWWPGSTRWA
jgi:MFS family permease